MSNEIDIKVFFDNALKNHKLNNIEEAINNYKKVLNLELNHFEANFLLGTLLAEKKLFDKAKELLIRAVKVNPNHSLAYNNLGIIFKELGEDKKAMVCFKNSILLNSKQILSVNNLSMLLKNTNLKSSNLNEAVTLLFRRNDVNHKDIFLQAFKCLFDKKKIFQINKVFKSQFLLEEKIICDLQKEELFQLMLQKSLIEIEIIEKLLINIRREILFIIHKKNIKILDEYFIFIISLAEQCFLNEYVYTVSQKENIEIQKLIDEILSNKDINESKIAILACYIPLFSNLDIVDKLLTYKSKNFLFNDLINLQINEPLNEKKLKRSIKSFQSIIDPISKKVSDQYEEFPYPRWRYTYSNSPSNFLNYIKKQIHPNRIIFNNKFLNPNVLIAGCGTGNHIFQAANYTNANITGIDLSLSSLAYAKRKIEESGLKNIELLHADVMELNKLNEKFHVIECVGVLHHLKDPFKGLKILVDLLEQDGFLLLGLYSEKSRQGVEKMKSYAKKNNFKNTLPDIRKFRVKIFDEKKDLDFKNISNGKDFFSASSVRDLVFHSQESCYNLTQISNILDKLNLEFLGFCGDKIKNKYSKMFPDDKKCISLKNWKLFETKYPYTFFGMYNFWVKKK